MNSLRAPILWRYLLFMHPAGIFAIWLYYGAIARAIIGRVFRTSATVSEHLHRPLHIRCDGVVFSIRPETDDLGMIALSVDPLPVTRSFRPKAGDVVVDVGANVGGYALRAAVVADRVIAIEPEPSNFRQLVENVRLNHFENVEPLQVAISNHAGSSALHLASDSGRHSLEVTAWGQPTGDNVSVQLLTLDEVITSKHIAHIDWLKVDVERHELAVLQGASKALSITDHLILEFELMNFPAVHSALRQHGLEILWHDTQAEVSVLVARSKQVRP